GLAPTPGACSCGHTRRPKVTTGTRSRGYAGQPLEAATVGGSAPVCSSTWPSRSSWAQGTCSTPNAWRPPPPAHGSSGLQLHVQISDNEYHFTVALGLAVFGDGLIDHLPWQRGSRRTDRDLVEEPTRGRGGRHGRKPTCPSAGNASPPTLSDIGLWSLPVGHDINHSLNYQKKYFSVLRCCSAKTCRVFDWPDLDNIFCLGLHPQ